MGEKNRSNGSRNTKRYQNFEFKIKIRIEKKLKIFFILGQKEISALRLMYETYRYKTTEQT